MSESDGLVACRRAHALVAGKPEMVSLAPPRREPAGITVADWVALVVGAAIVVPLPWPFWPHDPRLGAIWPGMSDFQGLSYFTTSLVGRACLSLVPVIFARRVRYGGVARPAEFLASACGLSQLRPALDHLLETLWLGFDPWIIWPQMAIHDEEVLRREELSGLWQVEMYWPWTMGMLAVACVAIAIFAVGRRRCPAWLQTVLLLVAWLGFSRAIWAIGSNVYPAALSRTDTVAGGVLCEVWFSAACLVPYKLLFDVPVGAAWHRLHSAHAPRPSWLEWLAMALLAMLFVASYSQEVFVPFRTGYRPLNWRFLPTTVVAMVLGIELSRRFLPEWTGLAPSGAIFTKRA